MRQVEASRHSFGRTLLMILAAGVVGAYQSSYAVPILFEFSGTVSDVSENDGSFGGLNPGDPFSAEFLLDDGSPDLFPEDPAHGRYSIVGASVEIPNMIATQPGGVLDVSNDATFDSLVLDSIGVDFQIRGVFTGEPTAMSSDAISTEFPPMNITHVLNVFAMTGSDKFAGTITSAVITPEPSLLGLMVVGLLSVRRRRS